MRNAKNTAVGVALIALMASACVSVLPEADPAYPRYGVSDVTQFDDAAMDAAVGKVAWSLAIDDPLATRAIDSAKIARVEVAQQYAYYSDGEWVDRAPRLVNTALIRSFQNSGRILSVANRADQPIADYVLQLDIRTFQADESEGSLRAVVEIYARLSDPRGRIKDARLFRQEATMRADTGMAAAQGLNRAMSALIDELAPWTVRAGEAAAAQ